MKRLFLHIFMMLVAVPGLYSQTVTLDMCKSSARNNYPLIRQYGLIERSRDLTLSNASKAWLPGVIVNVVAGTFSEIINMPTAVMGEMNRTLYSSSVIVTQPLYDGGAIAARRNVARADHEVEQKQAEVAIYDVNDRVEQLYFGVLMLNEQIEQLRLLRENLQITERSVESLIRGGLSNQVDLDAVKVNIVQTIQQEVGLQTMRKSYIDMLAYFCPDVEGLRQASIDFEKPSVELASNDCSQGSLGANLSLFRAQESLLNAKKSSLKTQLMPTLSAVGIASYHNKLSPMTKNNMFAAGLMLKWSIGALYTRKNDLASIENKRLQIALGRDTYLFNNHQQQQKSNGQIESLRKQMVLDDEVVALRERILEKGRLKVDNGTETVNELLREVNAVTEARQQKAIRQIQLLQEIYKLRSLSAVAIEGDIK